MTKTCHPGARMILQQGHVAAAVRHVRELQRRRDPALQACGDEELAWQEQRLEQAFMKIVDGPDGKDKDRLMDEQAAYMSDTNRYCSWNPAEDGQAQMLDAQSCRINRTANRADVLQALTSK